MAEPSTTQKLKRMVDFILGTPKVEPSQTSSDEKKDSDTLQNIFDPLEGSEDAKTDKAKKLPKELKALQESVDVALIQRWSSPSKMKKDWEILLSSASSASEEELRAWIEDVAQEQHAVSKIADQYKTVYTHATQNHQRSGWPVGILEKVIAAEATAAHAWRTLVDLLLPMPDSTAKNVLLTETLEKLGQTPERTLEIGLISTLPTLEKVADVASHTAFRFSLGAPLKMSGIEDEESFKKALSLFQTLAPSAMIHLVQNAQQMAWFLEETNPVQLELDSFVNIVYRSHWTLEEATEIAEVLLDQQALSIPDDFNFKWMKTTKKEYLNKDNLEHDMHFWFPSLFGAGEESWDEISHRIHYQLDLGEFGPSEKSHGNPALYPFLLDLGVLIKRHQGELDTLDGNGLSWLHWAVLRGHKELVDKLIKAGAHVEQPTQEGLTALQLFKANQVFASMKKTKKTLPPELGVTLERESLRATLPLSQTSTSHPRL